MSLSLSIFQKTCPGCASIVSIGAARCDCGHNFDAAANNQSPLEMTLRDEELYEGYLTARAEQARQAARAAAEAVAGDTTNPELISASALAREVAKSIDSDLAEQQAKIASIRNTLRDMEPVAPIVVPVQPVSTKHSTVLASPAPDLPPLTLSAPERPAPAATLFPIPAAPETTRTVAAPAKPAPAALWQATSTRKAADVLAAIKHAKVREAIARAQQAKAAAAQAPAPVAASAHGTVPPAAFRKEQASKAETIMEAHRVVDGKECPNCTSSVPLNTTRCQCGFAFKDSSTELPSLTLCTGDFTALRNSLNLNLRR